MIHFSISGTGVQTINLASGYSWLTDSVTIDASTQNGYSGSPLIELNGFSAGAGAHGFRIETSNSTIRGFAINRFNGYGIYVGSGNGNTIAGNYIGTNSAGTAASANSYGIYVNSGSNTIGGLSTNDRNVISGNTNDGIYIVGSSATNNVIQNNYIGINAAGTAAVANKIGIQLGDGSIGNTIGGTSASARNVISGNTEYGIYLTGSNTYNNLIQGNYIGTNAAGSAGIGNGYQGIAIANNAANNTIGGTTSGAGNLIAFNGFDGIALASTAGTGNSILRNSIYSNGGLGIDLSDNGVTANDSGDGDSGPNTLQNFPVLTSAVSLSGDTTISGSLNSAANTTYRIEFFYSPSGSEDASGYGEGRFYLDFIDVTTNGSGNATISAVLTGVMLTNGDRVTATATQKTGGSTYSNTSEFAMNVVVANNSAPTNTVPGPQTVNEDTAVSISGISVNDADGNLSSVQLSVLNGNLTVSLAGGATISAGANGTSTLTLGGSQAQINAALATLAYQGNLHFNGSDTLTVLSTDGNSATDSDTVAITVNAVNDAPTITNGATVTLAGTGQSTTSSGTLASNILSSASWAEVDGSPSSGLAITATTGLGTWQYSTDGSTWNNFGGVTSTNALLITSSTQVRYVAGASTETATFSCKAWDQTTGTASTNSTANYASTSGSGGTTAFSSSSASSSLVVFTVNSVVNAVDDSLSITEDTVTVIDPRTNDTDGNGDTKQIIDFTQTTNGTVSNTGDGTLTYNPNGNYNGSDGFEYLVADSGLGLTHFWGLNGNGTDSVGGTNGTVSGATAVTGAFGQGYSFDEVNDVVTTSDFSYSNSFTVSFDFRVDENSGTTFQYIYSHGTVSTANSLNIYLAEASHGTFNNQLFTNLQDSNDSAYAQQLNFDVSSIINDGLWHTYTLTVESGVGAKVYLDGVLRASDAARGGDAIDPTTGLFLGARNDLNVDRYYGGMLDNVMTANRAFQSSEVTAWSNEVNRGSVALSVTPVNDAPVLDNSGFMSLTTITENDTNNSGNTIAQIIASAGGDRITDVDSGAVEGIAISNVGGNGTWQYNTGSGWTDAGTVSTTSALLLRDTDSLRFVPNGQNGDTGTFLFQAWDQTSGSAGAKVDASNSGGSTAFSTQLEAGIIIVSSVNDAPTLTNAATYSMTSINEDSTSAGVTAATILGGTGYADVDSSAQSGIAISGRTGNGTWQYSTDGTTWVAFGAVSSTNALLLTSTTQVRYIGDTINGETANFSFVAWDRTSGTASTNGTPSYANPGAGGGTTAFSSQVATNQIVVTDVNDAPVLDNSGTMTLTSITEDQTSNSGQTIASVILSAGGDRITDVDNSLLEGIAITSLTNGNGTWQYSTDGGTNWNAVGTVSGSSALLLRSTDLVRFVPNGSNATSGSFVFRAWDQTSGAFGTKVDVSTNGGTTAFSSGTEVASITVSAVNDAPIITNASTYSLTSINENSTSSGVTAATILGSTGHTDVDSSSSTGIAITGRSGTGTWQYSTDGTTWVSFGAVSSTNALLLTSTTQVRFIGDNNNGETANFSFRAWDQTSGTASTNGTPSYADPGSGGGTTAFSSQVASGQIVVTSVNDAPTINNGINVNLPATDENTPSSSTTVSALLGNASLGYADVDTGALQGLAISAATGSGSWQYSTDGVTWVDITGVSSSNVLMLSSSTQIRFNPDGQNGGSPALVFRRLGSIDWRIFDQLDAEVHGSERRWWYNSL